MFVDLKAKLNAAVEVTTRNSKRLELTEPRLTTGLAARTADALR